MARTQVQAELIATNAISGTIIADNAITATHIATNSISGTLVQDSGIVTSMIAANNITSTKIVTDAVLTRHIADDQVTAAKLANSINTDIATGVAALPKAGGTMTGNITMGGMILKPSADGGSIGLNRNPDDGSHVGDSSLRRFQINGPDSTGGDFLQIQSYNSSGTHQGNVNIQDGNIGIGVTPDELLVVEGDIKIRSTNKLHFTNTSDQTSIHAPASNTIAISTNSSERMRIDSSGKIGIGSEASTVSSYTPQVQITGGSSGSGKFKALRLHHLDTTTTGDGPSIAWHGEYSGNSWKFAEMSATNGGAGFGANFAIDMHPGGGTQSSSSVATFSLDKLHEGIVRQRLNAQTFTLAANAQETFTNYVNTTALVNIASQRNGSNSIIYTGGLFYVVYSSSVITEIADVNDLFLTADTSSGAGKICIYKSNASATFYIVNRTSHTMTLSVHILEMQGN